MATEIVSGISDLSNEELTIFVQPERLECLAGQLVIPLPRGVIASSRLGALDRKYESLMLCLLMPKYEFE